MDLIERVSKIETTVANHEKRIENQESNNEVLVELKTLVKTQTEINKDQNAQMKDFNNIIVKVNDNLTHLNVTQEQIKNDMSKIGERVSHIEKSQDESKIDVPKLMVKIFVGIFMVIPTIVGTWILINLGLK